MHLSSQRMRSWYRPWRVSTIECSPFQHSTYRPCPRAEITLNQLTSLGTLSYFNVSYSLTANSRRSIDLSNSAHVLMNALAVSSPHRDLPVILFCWRNHL